MPLINLKNREKDMKKLLLTLIAGICTFQAYAYNIKIKNDTDDTKFAVSMAFQQGGFPSQDFELAPKQKMKIQVKNGTPLAGSGIEVEAISGPSKGKIATYMPEKLGYTIKFEIDIDDDTGEIEFEKKFFMFW